MSLINKLKGFEPTVLAQLNHPALAWAKPIAVRRRLFAFTMKSTAYGVAIGFIAGAIPGPLQVLTALLLCLAMRANVIAAVVATVWTNPLTIAPAYLLAHAIGRAVLPGEYPVPSLKGFSQLSEGGWMADLGAWVAQLGTPLAIGLPILALALAALGYFGVCCVWKKSDEQV